MTPSEVTRLANHAARRAGFARATQIVYDARRRYGAAVAKAIKGHRRKGRYVQAVCIVAVPSRWAEEPETVTFPAPEFEYERTIPTEEEWKKFSRFRRMSRYNDFRTCMKLVYQKDVGDSVDKLLDEFIANGVLIGPNPRTLPKPKARYARGKGLFTKED
jgi:hypothetical protein